MPITKLSPGEAELLEILWEHGPLPLSRVYEIYTNSGVGSPVLQTIQTRLQRMVAKKLLSRSSEYPALYAAAISKEQTQGKFFELLEELAGRNLAPLMLHLAQKRSLSDEEVQAMEKILSKHRKQNSRKKGENHD